MPPARRRAFSGRRSTRRRTSWVTVDQSLSIPAANGLQTIDLLASFKADGGTQQAVTIGRTHLRLIPTAGLANAGNNFHWGLIRGQAADVGTNIAGAPDPATQIYADWLLWEHIVTDQSSFINEFGGRQLNVDLRAMRKLEELMMNYNLALSVQASTVFPTTFTVSGRILLLLP